MYLTPLLNKLVTHTSRLEQSDLGPWQYFWNPEGYGLENLGLPCTHLSGVSKAVSKFYQVAILGSCLVKGKDSAKRHSSLDKVLFSKGWLSLK